MKQPKIIAEIGINHNGQLPLAFDLIRAAASAGAWAVKFQKRDVDIVYAHELQKERDDGNPYGWITYGQQKRGLEFGADEYSQIDMLCKDHGIHWFASAWDMNSLEFLERFNTPYHKIASAMLTNFYFVEQVARIGKKTFISIGGNYQDDIDKAIEIFNINSTPFVLMHCVSLYPCPYNNCNMNRINELITRAFTYGYEVGYSGHEVGILPSIVAMSLGAKYIERHITLDRSMYGSDQAASLEIPGLIKLCEYAEIIPKIFNSQLTPTADELKVIDKLRYWEHDK